MIPRNKTGNQTRTYFTNPLELLDKLNLSAEQMMFSDAAAQDFRFKVPLSYADKIQVGNPDDPLLRQIFPVQQELEFISGYQKDPLDEASSVSQPGLLQKYHGRALLLISPNCAIHCRYCFRRHYPYEDKGHLWKQIEQNIDLIKHDVSITEVILSGGDPLSLSDARIAELLIMLENIPHLKRLRIHTRFPVVEPERITNRLISILATCQLKIILVLHINHAHEISSDNKKSFVKLQKQQILLLNQSVLLRGVNDKVETLVSLSEQLIHNNIIPYYLHILDRVSGSYHFEVEEKKIIAIYQELRKMLPGYMLPRLVKEVPGEKSKIPVY